MLGRRRWPQAVVGGGLVVAAAVGAVAVGYRHAYSVSVFEPAALPERVQVCGRSFLRQSSSPVDPGRRARESFAPVGAFAPPLRPAMTVFGRPDLPECGMTVLVGPADDRLGVYTLQGGP